MNYYRISVYEFDHGEFKHVKTVGAIGDAKLVEKLNTELKYKLVSVQQCKNAEEYLYDCMCAGCENERRCHEECEECEEYQDAVAEIKSES